MIIDGIEVCNACGESLEIEVGWGCVETCKHCHATIHEARFWALIAEPGHPFPHNHPSRYRHTDEGVREVLGQEGTTRITLERYSRRTCGHRDCGVPATHCVVRRRYAQDSECRVVRCLEHMNLATDKKATCKWSHWEPFADRVIEAFDEDGKATPYVKAVYGWTCMSQRTIVRERCNACGEPLVTITSNPYESRSCEACGRFVEILTPRAESGHLFPHYHQHSGPDGTRAPCFS